MLKELSYILCCLGVSSLWGYKVYRGIKNKDKFDIVYCSIVAGIFLIMMAIKIIEIIIGQGGTNY